MYSDIEETMDKTMGNILFEEVYKNYDKFNWIKNRYIIAYDATFYVKGFRCHIELKNFGVGDEKCQVTIRLNTCSLLNQTIKTDILDKVDKIAIRQPNINDVISAIRNGEIEVGELK